MASRKRSSTTRSKPAAAAEGRRAPRTRRSSATAKGTTKPKTNARRAAKREAQPPQPAKGPRRRVPNPALREILAALRKEYPDAHCALEHRDAFQLLIATILSAQCTDARVNIVTRTLFRKYPTPADFADASQEELEEDIRSTGFFRNKAKNIRAACRDIVEKHGGQVPDTMKELSALAGVGRKTANVVLGNAWGNPDGVVVDTHVARISHKLALTNESAPEKIERDLNELIPRKAWVLFPHWLIHHGRRVCSARSPKCDDCVLVAFCPSRA